MDYRVQSVIALLEKHLQRDWTAGRLSQCVNLSPSRLHQLFKEETGVPPARYLRLLRMGRAKELLETTHLSVKEIMARVGVADESHFVRDFKKAYGATPARYRQLFLGRQSDELPAHETSPPAPGQLDTTGPSAPAPSATPPLLLRRPSYPRHLSADAAAPLACRRRRELLALMLQRHSGFAQLTAALGASIADGMTTARHISYEPRRSTVPRRLPPAVERPRPRTPARAPFTPGRGRKIG
jgi:AraC-like DNA-binding protein